MSSKTKIIVLHMKEIIYTIIFAAFGILILCLLFFMFSGNRKSSVSDKKYIPGIYSSSFVLGNETLELEIAVSESSIDSIRITNMSDTISAMYPLLQPSLEDLTDQILNSQSLDKLNISDDNPYTSRLLVDTIRNTLKKAAANN